MYNQNYTQAVTLTDLGYQLQRRYNYLKDIYPIIGKYEMIYLLENISILPAEIQHEFRDLAGAISNMKIYNELVGKEDCTNEAFINSIKRSFGSIKNLKDELLHKVRNLQNGNCFLVLDRFANYRIITLYGNNSPYSFTFFPLICLNCLKLSVLKDVDKMVVFKNYLDNLNLNKLAKRYQEGLAFWAKRRMSSFASATADLI